MAKELSPTGKDISQIHVDDMLKVISREGNRSVNLPFGIIVRKQYDYVILEQGKEPIESEYAKPEKGQCIKISMEQDGLYGLGEWGNLDISHIFQEKWQELPRNQYTKWFDYDKIRGTLWLRGYRTGDRIGLLTGSKAVKTLWTECKVPKEERGNRMLVADDEQVIWIPGVRCCDNYRIDESTATVLEIQKSGGKENGSKCQSADF